LEKVLPLELFELTQQDSVMYYAFAEDIRPGSPQRTESDLRFIDIRPFRRQYRLIDPEAGQMSQGGGLKTLEELIARQRYALNRAVRLSRTFEHTGQADLSAVDSLTKFEGELAKSTRELAEGLEALGINETELLYQAETSMLAAADSLAAGKYDTAALQMRDALKDLIEGRNRLRIDIFKNPNRQMLAQLRLFDRLQQQKLRRPKSDEEEARQLVERLEALADSEDFVYAALAGTSDADAPPSKSASAAGESAKSSGDGADAKDAGTPENRPSSDRQADRKELEDRQLDIALESRDLQKALEKLKGATDLAKQRMDSAAKSAEQAAEALDRGKSDEAQASAGEAKTKFRELAEQVAALAAKEQADRIAAAQQMAAELARRQQEFKDRLADAEGSAGGDGKPQDGDQPPQPGAGQSQTGGDSQPGGLAGDAEEIADKAETLADVLAAAARADGPEDQESAKKVEELVRSLDLKALAERLAQLPEQVRQEKLADARAVAGDGARRVEAAAERVGALRRAIVAPQVDELAKLEEQLAALDDRLDKLDSDPKISGWHDDADELLERLDGVGIDKELRQEFVDEMRQAGWTSGAQPRTWNWRRGAGAYYAAPPAYTRLLSRMADSLRARMQELMLGDLTASGDEPVPPQYADLVDRYYRVLASEKQGRGKPPAAKPE